MTPICKQSASITKAALCSFYNHPPSPVNTGFSPSASRWGAFFHSGTHMLRGLLGGYARGRRQTSSATLSLNFLAGINDSRITYSGGANGTRVNSAGVIVAATTPRFDYDPVTLAAKGLLVEEARTNLLLRSDDFSTTWTQTNITITANSTTSPDGSANADTLVINAAGALTSQITQSFTAGSVITVSVFAKKNASNFVRFELGGVCSCWFRLDTGSTGTNQAGSGNVLFGSKAIQAFTNGWYRCILTVTTTTITTLSVAIFATDSDGATSSVNSSVFLYGAMAEVGSFPTSYIPTTTAAVTRTADSAVMTGTNFSDWYNQSEGTFVCKGDLVGGTSATFPYLIAAAASTVNTDLIGFNWASNSGTLRAGIVEAGTQTADIPAGASLSAGSLFSGVIAYGVGASFASAGVLGTDDLSVTLPTCDRLLIAGAARFQPVPSCHIASINYYPRRAANEQLQALTA